MNCVSWEETVRQSRCFKYTKTETLLGASYCYFIMADPTRLTVKQLTEECGRLGKKPPSGLRKAEILEFYQGLQKMVAENIPFTEKYTGDDLQYTPVYCQLREGETWLQHLHREGWATVPIPDFDPAYYEGEFFGWLESMCDRFDRNDPATWNNNNIPPNFHGIFKQYIGHTEWIWQIREKCLSIFEEIWQTDDLVCSFDGGCFLPYPRGKMKQWIHNDSPRSMTDFTCVQGLVNLRDNGPEDGGLLLLERSQEIFKDYIDRHPTDGFSFYFADMTDPELQACRPIKICAPAGHIILWDGRVFHCNVSPTTQGHLRMCTYVSMQPRAGTTAKEIEKRITLHTKGRMTGHWCYGPFFKDTGENPRTYGKEVIKPNVIEIAETTSLRKKMIGYPPNQQT